jgi:hypothetical protein
LGLAALVPVVLNALAFKSQNDTLTLTPSSASVSHSSQIAANNLKPDLVSGYLFVIDHLARKREISALPLKYLAIDTRYLVGLTADDKAKLLASLDKYHLQVLEKSFDELKAEGYIKTADMVFEQGAYIKLENINVKGTTITMDARIYFAGLNGSGLLDFDITDDSSGWAITRIGYIAQA